MDDSPFIKACEKITGKDIDVLEPCGLNPHDTASFLYATALLFREKYERLKSLPYNPRFEKEASEGILECAQNLSFSPLENISVQAQRVLLERLHQYIQISFGWDKDIMTVLPCCVPYEYWQLLVCVKWLYPQKIPLPAQKLMPDEWLELSEAPSYGRLQ